MPFTRISNILADYPILKKKEPGLGGRTGFWPLIYASGRVLG
jgi:hypothetical protein